MPIQKGFGSKTTADSKGGIFVQLKAKGEKLRFRFIRPPAYDGKHFIKEEDGKWNVLYCPRIMTDEYCEYCEKYFALMKETKTLEGEERKTKEKEARNSKAKITFYYPIIDREDGKAKLLKTALSVRLKVDEKTKMGIDVTKYDFILMRTEKPGTDYYTLEKVDSAETKPLTKEEKKEVEEAMSWDLQEKIKMKVNESDQEFAVQEEEPLAEDKVEDIPNEQLEQVEPEEMPF